LNGLPKVVSALLAAEPATAARGPERMAAASSRCAGVMVWSFNSEKRRPSLCAVVDMVNPLI
jgi:hypothetical protein